MSNIADKVVVITGASSGVGESTARLLAGNGAKVALGARRKDRIDALVRDINAKGGSALGFKTDVTKRGDVEALVKGAVDRHGRIDAIVNNSGIMPIAPMAALKVEEWDRMIDVNIKGLLYGVAAVLPIMQKQKMGHIINIASVELPEGSSEEATRKNLREFYKIAISPDSVARAIAYTIKQPSNVDIGEVVIRPTALDF